MNESEFIQHINAHQAVLHKLCRLYRQLPQDREDLFQEMVYQLWRSLPGYSGRAKFSTWLYRVALSTALAGFRKRGPSLVFTATLPEVADAAQVPAQQEALWAAMRQLNDADKALLALYLEDLTYEEMAEVTGLSVSNVGVKLNRIRQKISSLLNKAT